MCLKTFVTWANKKIKKMDIWDISLTKLSVLFATLFLVSIWPVLADAAWYWYILGVLVFAWRPMKKFFT